ncbi:MAG: AMP-binding protein [Candidatus Methylomirabilia bacterium]
MTLTELLGRRAATTPNATYFTLFGQAVTYGQLWEMSHRHAAGLAAAGIGQGDKVCLVYPTCAEFFYTFVGGLRLGAIPVPLYPTMTPEGMANVFNNSEAKAVVSIDWFRSPVEEARAAALTMTHFLTPLELEAGAPLPPLPTARPEDTAFLQYTSGSTGHPRGVVLSHANVLETIKSMALTAELTAEDTVVSWLPLYHDMGLIGCSFTPPLVGAKLVLLPPDLSNPRQWLQTITEERATFTVSPDFGYRNCVRNVKETQGLDLSSLKMALSGAEAVRLSTIGAFEEKFNLKSVVAPCYGLAEATLAVSIWPRGEPVRLDPSGRVVAVGKPCRGVSIRIMEGEAVLPPGQEGEVVVKSPGVMQGYYNNPQATRRVLTQDGWLRTGDLGFLDPEGCLYITGRLKDLIIVAGQNIAPSDIEDAVDQVTGIRYSAAVGIESERLGTQRLHVVAEVRDTAVGFETLSRLVREIVQRVHARCGHRPARVLLAKPRTLPMTSSGKIQRSRLAQLIVGGKLADSLVFQSGHH